MEMNRIKKIVFLLGVVLIGFAHASDAEPIQVKYKHDRFSGKHSLTIPEHIVSGDMASAVSGGNPFVQIMIVAEWEDGKDIQDGAMQIAFLSVSEEWAFLDNNDVYLLVDGARMKYLNCKHRGSTSNGSVVEMITHDITLDQLRELGNASSVEGRLGLSTKFTLSPDYLNAVKRFYEKATNTNNSD